MTVSPSHAWVEIDLSALKYNLRILWRDRGDRGDRGRSMIAVVKADAYGHGAVEVAEVLCREGVTMLAVATVTEGAALRAAGIVTPILLLGGLTREECRDVVELGLAASVSSIDAARYLSEAARERGATVPVHVKIDTGMGRLGIPVHMAVPRIETLSLMPGLFLEGIYTHFATSDEVDKSFALQQAGEFNRLLAALEAVGITLKYHHAANTAACMEMPEALFDTIRPGIGLYGLHPCVECGRGIALRPIMEFAARVVHVDRRPAGATIGYGRTHRLVADSTVAVVSAGYADGYDRRFSGKASVTINGKLAPVLGRVSMDLISVDATGVPGVAIGDKAVLFSRDPAAPNSVENLACMIDTIPYTLTCGVSKRVHRVYANGA